MFLARDALLFRPRHLRFSLFCGLLTRQPHAALHMVRIGELIEQRQPGNLMRLRQRLQIVAQRLGVAGDVKDARIGLHHLHRFVIQPAARWIDKNGFALIALQVDAL